MKRIMVRAPGTSVEMWCVDVVIADTLLNDFMAFCRANFGTPKTALTADHPWADPHHLKTDRWPVYFHDRLNPPWLELYFRSKADVAILKLYDEAMVPD